MKRQLGALMFATLVAVLTAGCGDEKNPGQDIGIADSGPDTFDTLDVLEDTSVHDLIPDAGQDLHVPDGGPETGLDTATDENTAPDTNSDEGSDTTADLTEDPGVDEVGQDSSTSDTVADAEDDTAEDTVKDLPVEDVAEDLAEPETSVPDSSTEDLTQDPGHDTLVPPEPIEINGVVPMSAVENTAFTLTMTGTGMTPDMTARIAGNNVLTQGYEAYPLTVNVDASGHSIEASFEASNGLIRGYYQVELIQDGVVKDSLAGFRILAAGGIPPTVTGVTPDTAKTGRDRMVTVTGTGFMEGASVFLNGNGNAWECSYVEVADATTLTAVVQAGTNQIPVGDYEFWVVNPDGLAGFWSLPFRISDIAPPSITAISPARSGNAANVNMTVTGTDFLEGAQVSLLSPTGDLLLTTTVVTEGSVLGAVIPASLTAGIYPVKVTNPDQQFDIFYFYQVSNNSPGSLTTFEAMGSTLHIPRWQHGLDAMIDGMGHGFLVVTGGLDASGVPIDDVEISQVSPNGAPGNWFIPTQTDPITGQRITNRMNEPRSGAATTRIGRALIIAGGRSNPEIESPAVTSIEMTRMLTGSGAPRVRPPSEEIDGGLLPEGRWLYRVSAVTSAGETLASSSVSYRGSGGKLSIFWEPVQDAVAYNIYRCPAANCTYGQEIAIAWMLPSTTRSFHDDGIGVLTPSPSGLDSMAYPDDPGSLVQAQYSYVVTSITTVNGSSRFESIPGGQHDVIVPGGTGTVSLIWSEVPGAESYSVYRSSSGGPFEFLTEVPAGTLDLVDDLAPIVPSWNPPIGIAPLPTGSLSLFSYILDSMDNPIQLNVGREGARATYVETEYDETDPDAVTGALFILGGRSGFMPLSGSEDTIEGIRFMIDGTLVGPSVEQVRMVTGRSFFGLGNSQSRLDNLTFEEEDDDDPVTPDCLDVDQDGFFDATCGGTDCDDTNILINPAAWENLQNGIDDNCDGLVDVPTQGWDAPPPNGGKVVIPRMARALDPDPEPVFLIAMLGNDDVLASNDTGLNDIEAIGVDLYTGELMELNQTPSLLWTVQTNTDNSLVHGVNIALYQKYLFSFMGVGSENLGQVPGNLIAQSKRFPYCPPPEPDDPGDSSFGCPGYTGWTYKDLAGQKRTSANATVSGGLGYYGLARAFGYIYLVAGVNSSGVSNGTWRVLQ